METTPTNIFERMNQWIKESVTIKLLSIGFLLLILLIPASWVESLIAERQQRAQSVVDEISDKWSGEQTLSGPILVIPFLKREKIDKGKEGTETREWKEKAFFLPDQLTISGKVKPQKLHHGIFEAAVYEAALEMQSTFTSPDFSKLKIAPQDILWQESYLVLGINDLRGIRVNPTIKIGGTEIVSEPSSQIGVSTQYKPASIMAKDEDYSLESRSTQLTQNGITSSLSWKTASDFQTNVTISLALKGSSQLCFVPTGKTTKVSLGGAWPNPSFTGNFATSSREVNEQGFTAQWDVLHYNRPFAQQWSGEGQRFSGSEFGVQLLLPVGQYQKSMRTAKYGALVIILTFVALFMVEIMRKVRIHPFQYILVGATLIIYYSLLLSFSEQVGFDVAYWIASLATITLISFYSFSFFDVRKLSGVLAGLLFLFYAFVFVIIQLQDYSLLLGSIGLFIIVGLIMYFSKDIKWYGEELNKRIN